jgi:CHAT domain-containing protein
LSCCELIFPVIDDLKNSSMTEEGRLFIADNERKTYDQAVSLALSLYDYTGDRSYITKAFLIAEKAKYTTLLMAVRNNDALSFSRVPDDMLHQLQGFKNRISSYRDLIREEELSGNPGEEKLRLWQEELYTLEDREQEFIRELEKDYPDYFRLKFNTSVSGPEEIMAHLNRKDRLIEYYLTGNTLVAFVLAGGEINVHVHPVDSAFLMKMDTMRRFCYSNTLISNRMGQASQFRRISSELYDILIRPCDVHPGDRLILIPDAGMNYLPFDALLSDSKVSSIYYRDYPFLIKSNPIIYSYSATLLMNTRPVRNPGKAELLAMAPAYGTDPEERASVTRELDINRQVLTPLQGTVEEITGIQKITGGAAISGNEASEYRFKQLAPHSGILHMAMHAFVDDTDPLFSKLVFSENREGGEDGFLNTYEIYDLELHARMVVLSACQTGAGIVRMGEGIMSLARAFYYSGVPNVVMTLWAVSDTSGRKLMVDFYDWLSYGLDKGKAMQQAKIRYLESADPLRQQPYYWAGYIVTGDPSPVFKPRIKWVTAALIALLIAVTVTLIIRNRRRRAEHAGQPLKY